MIKKVKPDFFHRIAWMIFHNVEDINMNILDSLTLLFEEMDEELHYWYELFQEGE